MSDRRLGESHAGQGWSYGRGPALVRVRATEDATCGGLCGQPLLQPRELGLHLSVAPLLCGLPRSKTPCPRI